MTHENPSNKEIIMSCHDDVGARIDSWLAGKNRNMSRTYIKKLISENLLHVNGETVKANYKLKLGDIIKLNIPKPKAMDTEPEAIEINVIYEDSSIIVIDKPQGMVVHPAAGNKSGTLVNALLHHCGDSLSDINGVLRPGIVHRLDKDTSGVIVVAKTNNSHRKMVERFKKRDVKKVYHAIVDGVINEEHGKIDAPVGRHPVERKKMSINKERGRNAITHFQVLKRLNRKATLLEIILETGRTHQIRVHMSFIGHPVLGDNVYGRKHTNNKLDADRQMLHASVIGFKHPETEEYMEFESRLPEYFTSFLDKLMR